MPTKKTTAVKTNTKVQPSVKSEPKETVESKVEYNTVSKIETPVVEQTSATGVPNSTPDVNLAQILSALQGLQSTVSGLTTELTQVKAENKTLQEQNQNLQDQLIKKFSTDTQTTMSVPINVNEPVKTENTGWPVDQYTNYEPNYTTTTGYATYASQTQNNQTEALLQYLANKKSEREITIVHNRELIGGLTTHIELTGLIIDFRTLGEKRVLSWQQFEECVSKYRKWFEREIILLDSDNKELAEAYHVPMVKRNSGVVLTRGDLARVGDMDPRQLEDFFNSLTKEDQGFLCSYWLGKCYEKDPKFYNRYKIDTLSRLADNGCFDNIIALMNNDYNKKTTQTSNVQNGQNVGQVYTPNTKPNADMIGAVR